MNELSLYILDLVQNSISAGANLVEIRIVVSRAEDRITVLIQDDGCGMTPEFLKRAVSPFTTTRTTRKVGLGIPLMMQNARLAGGDVRIDSTLGQGTTLTATLHGDSIDCLPLGDLAGTVVSLVSANPERPDFRLSCSSPKGSMDFDTREMRQALGNVPLNEPEITAWMLSAIQEEIEPIFGGVIL